MDPDNRIRFELMGLERVRIALLRGFDIPRGPMREDALDWVKEQEDRQERSRCRRSLDSGFGHSCKPTLAATGMLRPSGAQANN